MKISLLLALISTQLVGAPIKVPTEMYKGSPNLRDHPGHYPFISYLTYRNECTHIIDQSTEWFDPQEVQQGDIIYLNGWYLDWFAKYVHDQIPVPYILLTADVGAWFPSPDHKKLLYDPKLAAWFCRNMVFSYHPKLFQIPMGQDLALFHHGKELYDQLISAVVHKDSISKNHLLYMCFFPRTHGDRDKIEKMFINEPYCYSINRQVASLDEWCSIFKPRPQFYQDIASSYFALSPLGLETDSIRTWEALVLDCIPIVEHTFLDPCYEGLPVVIVHDWNEINQEFLEKKYEELKGLKLDRAYFDYWRNILKQTQKKVQDNDLFFSQLEATSWESDDLEVLSEILSNTITLNYNGFLATMRPFELAQQLPCLKINLYDPWLDNSIFFQLYHRLPAENMQIHIPHDSEISCFLDLTYYRTSLKIDFSTSVIKEGNFRHNLKNDLNDLYSKLKPGNLICGNQFSNPYVREVLDAFSKENQVTIERKGSFWFATKIKIISSLAGILPDPYPEIYQQHNLLPSSLAPMGPHQCVFKNLIENANHVVEVGSWLGCSTRHFAELIPGEGKVFAVYDWKNTSNYQQFLSNMIHAGLTDKIIPVRMNSLAAAKKLVQLDIPIDLIYIDSTNEPLYENLCAWYPLVKNHGILCGDDWSIPEVEKAVLKFAKENNIYLFIQGDLWTYFPGF